MSIIAEALKKSQGGRRNKAGVLDPRLKEPEAAKPRHKKRLPSPLFYATMTAIVLFLLLSALLFYFTYRGPVKEKLAVKTPLRGGGLAVSPEEVKEPLHALQTAVKEEEEISTPLSPQARAITLADVKKTIKLNGIMYTAKKPLAVINNSMWTEGDYIDEFEILEIGKDFIRVASGGQEFVIKLKR